jgi:HSP20 family molecular chaperone IbpA
LPVLTDVDESKIEAKFDKGILYIELPKTEEARKKVTHISVEAA